MDPKVIALLIEKNGNDIKTIVNKIGLETLMDLAPNFLAIVATLQSSSPKSAE
jgi:hypothetical protein